MKKISVIIIVFSILGAGCSKDFLSSLQDNPNAPTTGVATPALVLPGAISAIINVMNGPTNGSGGVGSYEYPAVWMGYWNYAPGYSFNPNPQNYVVNSSTPQVWNQYYGALSNLNFMVQQTAGVTHYSNYHGIANILEAVCFKNLVDLYNDVPYSQALQAQGNFYPGYDKGSDVYDSVVDKLDAAMAELQANVGNLDVDLPTTDDIVFGGDISSWILYANTLKLSMLVQQINVSAKSAYLATEASKTASLGYLTTDALVNPGFTTSLPSPSWANFGISPSGALNNYFTYVKGNQGSIDFYKATNDQRLAYIYSKADAAPTDADFFTPTLPLVKSDYQADYTGTQNQLPPPGVSGLGPGIMKSPDAGAPFLTAAESYFWQAEATLFGWLPGGAAGAKTLYEKGITASYEYLGVGGDISSADTWAATYIAQGLGHVVFPVSASVDSLDNTIIYQRWAALNSISNFVAYNDWRRTFSSAKNSGIPAVPYSVSTSITAPHMPFRFPYPLSEVNNNNASWSAAGGAAVASDPYNSKIFWMP